MTFVIRNSFQFQLTQHTSSDYNIQYKVDESKIHTHSKSLITINRCLAEIKVRPIPAPTEPYLSYTSITFLRFFFVCFTLSLDCNTVVFTWSNRICCKISNSIQSFVKATKLLGNNEINWQTSNRANWCFIWEIKRIKFKWYLFFNEKYDDRLHSTIFPLKKKNRHGFCWHSSQATAFFSLSPSFTYKHSIHTLGSSLFHHQQQNNKNNNELCWLLCNNKCSTVKVGFPEQCVFSLLGFFINSLDLIYIFFFFRSCLWYQCLGESSADQCRPSAYIDSMCVSDFYTFFKQFQTTCLICCSNLFRCESAQSALSFSQNPFSTPWSVINRS